MSEARQPKISFGTGSTTTGDVLPLRLVAVADLAPEDSALAAGPPRLHSVDKDSFNDFLRTVCPKVVLHLQDPQTPHPSFTTVQFAPEDLKSFHPAALSKNVESLQKLLEGRQALLDLRDRKLSRDQFLERLKSAPLPFLSAEAVAALSRTTAHKASENIPLPPAAAPPAATDASLDSILNMVEAPPDRTFSRPPSLGIGAHVQQFINAMTDSPAFDRPVDRAAVERLLAEADQLLSNRMNDILEHAEFRRLEAAWRSLKFLVDRIDFRAAIQLQVVAARKEDLLNVLNLLLEEAQVSETPVAVVITDFEFDRTSSDMDLLRQAAQLSEQLIAPILVNVGERFFGKKSASEVAGISVLPSHMESPAFVKWSGFRESEVSRWVGVAFNRFLLRGCFDESSAGKIPFNLQARGGGLWGQASWAIATLLARSFASSQWCGYITGIQGGGLVENLPLQAWCFPSGEETRAPLQTLFLHGREDDFAESGFLVLQSGQDQDMAVLLRAPTAHRAELYPEKQDTETARLRATLTYQLVASRFVQYLGPLLRRYSSMASPAEMQKAIEQGMRPHLGTSDTSPAGSIKVEFRDSEIRTGFWDIMIKINPGPAIWRLPVEIDLIIPVRKF